jgi:hypothetical protein
MLLVALLFLHAAFGQFGQRLSLKLSSLPLADQVLADTAFPTPGPPPMTPFPPTPSPPPTPPTPPPWQPENPLDFPVAKNDSKVSVYYLTAPLLESAFGHFFEYLNVYHGALAFVEDDGFNWTVNFDANSTKFFAAQFPKVERAPNGTEYLKWNNGGVVAAYLGINQTYWVNQQPIATITGALRNRFVNRLANSANATWSKYEMMRVTYSVKSTPYVNSRECFDFVADSIGWLVSQGATNVPDTMRRNIIMWFTDNAPNVANYTDPTTQRKIIDFYAVLSLAWGKATSLPDLIKSLVELAFHGDFYYYAGDVYYSFRIAFPYFEVAWTSVSTPTEPMYVVPGDY